MALPQTRSTHGELAPWATWGGDTFSWAVPLGQGCETAPSPQHSPFFLGRATSRMKALAVKGIIGHPPLRPCHSRRSHP